jgi:hypothetical protein
MFIPTIGLGRNACGIVALGKGDRRRNVAKLFVLIQEPVRSKVPPFGAVEEIIESRGTKLRDLLGRGAQSFREKPRLGVCFPGRLNDLRPYLTG